MGNLNQALQEVQFAPFPEIFDRFRKLSKEYGGLPVGNLVSAFTRATGNKFEFNNPYIQSRRVKKISSLPENYSKDKVGEMLLSPDTNEQDLRQVEHGLEFTAYPLLHTRKMYQDLLTYHSYVAPQMLEKGDEKALAGVEAAGKTAAGVGSQVLGSPDGRAGIAGGEGVLPPKGESRQEP